MPLEEVTEQSFPRDYLFSMWKHPALLASPHLEVGYGRKGVFTSPSLAPHAALFVMSEVDGTMHGDPSL